jgi:hypothetical protein
MTFRFKNLRKNRSDQNKSAPSGELNPRKNEPLTSQVDATTSNPKRIKLTAARSLPPIPEAETIETYKDHCKRLCKEMAKPKARNLTLIKEIMDCSFAMRRREIIEEPKPVAVILKKFPALSLPFEVSDTVVKSI